MTFGPTKGHERRDIPIPRLLVDELVHLVAGKEPDILVFTGARGAPMRSQTFQRTALTAAAAAMDIKGFTPTCCGAPRLTGDRVRRGREGGANDARTQVGHADAGSVRPPVWRPARRRR